MTDTDDELPPGRVRRPRFSFVWMIPIIAVLIAGYLGYRTITEEGPLLTLTFRTADGLTSGQTQLKYKSVALGTVESIALSKDHTKVIVGVRMTSAGAPFMTSNARFWVVKPNFSASGISGLDTLISGSYITLDPGLPGGASQDHFTGLEEPPGVRSDEPGSTFVLKADNIGSLGSGSPVFYRDVVVGEVLGYDMGSGVGPVTINVFIHAPYDQLVRQGSHFWNSSGIAFSLQGGAFRVVMQSFTALLSGGVTFDLPPDEMNSPPSPANTVFPLFDSKDAADAAGYQNPVKLVTYFQSSVNGLVPGAPVEVLGIQVGQVTSVNLQVDPATVKLRVRVAIDFQPERIFRSRLVQPDKVPVTLQNMVNRGLRTQIETANYVTGQQIITLSVVPGAKPFVVTREGDAFVIPSQPSAFGDIMANLNTISGGLAKVPFEKIGNNLNALLVSTNATVGNGQITKTLQDLSQTLATANTTLVTLNHAYGDGSDFQQDLEQLMEQTSSTMNSINQLTGYLNRNPSALIRGRSAP
jgi:paraquat-inducible protein B